MTEETAKALAEAMNRLASAIEKATGPNGFAGHGIQVFHHGFPQPQYQQQPHTPYYAPHFPATTWGTGVGTATAGSHS